MHLTAQSYLTSSTAKQQHWNSLCCIKCEDKDCWRSPWGKPQYPQRGYSGLRQQNHWCKSKESQQILLGREIGYSGRWRTNPALSLLFLCPITLSSYRITLSNMHMLWPSERLRSPLHAGPGRPVQASLPAPQSPLLSQHVLQHVCDSIGQQSTCSASTPDHRVALLV